MAEGRVENLKPQNTRTKEEQREIARLGGIASGVARRKQRTFKEIAEALGSATIRSGDVYNLDEIERIAELKDANLSVKELMLWQQIQKAMNGDTKAFEVVRDTLGEKPFDKVEMKVNESKDSLDRLVEQLNE